MNADMATAVTVLPELFIRCCLLYGGHLVSSSSTHQLWKRAVLPTLFYR